MRAQCLWAAAAILICSSIYSSAAEAQTSLTFNKQTGLFTARYHTVDVIKSSFVFWHGNWQWSDVSVKGKAIGQTHYSIKGASSQTGLTVIGDCVQTAPNELTWTMNLARSGDSKEWGGIAFDLNLGGFAPGEVLSPKILPVNAGWELQLEPSKPPLRVSFTPRPASVFFEASNPHQIRVYFNKAEVPFPPTAFKMTVTLPPGGVVEPSIEERLAPPNPDTWYRNLTFWNRSPVDLSFLNMPERPAGKHGFLKTRDDKLVFEDGHSVRFWGTNLTAYALFGTNFSNARIQARRLSQLGFNLVRIHHHDSAWVSPNIFGIQPLNTRSLDSQSLQRLDWWIKCLKDEGIYVWLDLDVGRSFTAEDDIDAFAEISKGKSAAVGKGFSYFNLSIKLRMKEFAQAYLNHVNIHTGLSYKDDPAVAFVLLTNENDLTHHFGNWLLPDKNVPQHNSIYMHEAQEFAQRRGLDPELTWRSWEYGPSKLFLNDIEHDFNADMISYLRKLGVRIPIITTNSWGGMTLAGLPSLTDGDVVDVHSYGGAGLLESDPRYKANIADWISAASVLGKPIAVSEWNVSPYPTTDRAALPVYLASLGGLQGWNALIEYAYSQSSLDMPQAPNNWDMANDPTMLAMMPAAALMYRRGDVSEGTQTFLLSPTAKILMSQALSPNTSRAIRTLTERNRVRVLLPEIRELPWFVSPKPRVDSTIVEDFGRDLSVGQTALCADTGAFCRDWRSGIFTVQTPRSQVASGWIGGKQIDFENVTLLIDTANATVAVQSLDEQPLGKSTRVLISMAAQSLPISGPPTMVLSEPVQGLLRLKLRPGLHAFRLDADGEKESLPVRFADGVYSIRLDRTIGSYWLLLEM